MTAKGAAMADAFSKGAFSLDKLEQAAIPPAWLKPLDGFKTLAGPPIVGGWSVTIRRAGFYRFWIDGLYGVSPMEFLLTHNGVERGWSVREGEGGQFVFIWESSCQAGDRIALDDGADTDDPTRHQSMPRIVAVPLLYGDVGK